MHEHGSLPSPWIRIHKDVAKSKIEIKAYKVVGS